LPDRIVITPAIVCSRPVFYAERGEIGSDAQVGALSFEPKYATLKGADDATTIFAPASRDPQRRR
jgi:hypothetical protein